MFLGHSPSICSVETGWVGGLGTNLLVLIFWLLFHFRAELLLQTYKTAFQVSIYGQIGSIDILTNQIVVSASKQEV